MNDNTIADAGVVPAVLVSDAQVDLQKLMRKPKKELAELLVAHREELVSVFGKLEVCYEMMGVLEEQLNEFRRDAPAPAPASAPAPAPVKAGKPGRHPISLVLQLQNAFNGRCNARGEFERQVFVYWKKDAQTPAELEEHLKRIMVRCYWRDDHVILRYYNSSGNLDGMRLELNENGMPW